MDKLIGAEWPLRYRKIWSFSIAVFLFRLALRQTSHPLAFKYVHDALSNIDKRCRRGLGDAKVREEPSRSPPVRNCDSVAGQAVKPLTHATGDGFVALPTGRNKTPFVLLTRGDTLWIACVQLGNRQAFPIAEGNFGKSWLQAIAVRRQTECRAHQIHRFACTSERA